LIENGGCLLPLLSSVSLPAGEESNKEAVRFPIMETARRCFPAGCLLAFTLCVSLNEYHSYKSL